MLALCLLVGALCVVAIHKARSIAEEPPEPEEDAPDPWAELPPKWHPPVAKTGGR